MHKVAETVQEIVPQLYAATAEQLQMPYGTDMSRGNRCDVLSLSLFRALDARGIESRRELHGRPDGRWHYLIAHTALDADPSETDIITDLNPWQYGGNRTGFLHDERQAVQEILGTADAPNGS